MPGNKSSGRTSQLAGMRMFKKLDENPHHEGNIGWFAWEALEEAMKYEDYQNAPSASVKYLRFWVDEGWVEPRITEK